MIEIIKSEQNQRVKELKKLYSKRNRRKKGKFVLEGYRIIDEALKSDAEFDNIYMSVDFYESEEGRSLLGLFLKDYSIDKLIILGEKLLEKIADTDNPQGVIAVVNENEYGLEDDVFKGKDTLLLLDRIQDPGNMGTIIRTAVAAGIDGIIILKGSVDIYNLKVLRATMGAVFKIPLVQGVQLNDFLGFIENKYKLISTDLSTDIYYHQLDYQEAVVIAIGNEANGLDDKIISHSDYKVKIPIIGEIDSLNAAIAAGLIIYKAQEGKWK